MEKQKFDFSKYADMHEERTVQGKDGVIVSVRDHIPYDQKDAMATEMAQNLLMIHDDSCVYTSSEFDKTEKYMIAKYYTSIDTEDCEPEEISDFLVNNEMFGDIAAFIWTDYEIVFDIFKMMETSVKKTYEDDHGLTKAIRTSFGFLFNGEDISESMAKAEATHGILYDALDALQKTEKAKEENIDNGTVKIGGNIINFAKKTE